VIDWPKSGETPCFPFPARDDGLIHDVIGHFRCAVRAAAIGHSLLFFALAIL
jgi:hypothetical protein